ncbi:MAG: aminoglycoside adenylyltransferase domain-containing protein [Ktedonobacteraceae bacterium]
MTMQTDLTPYADINELLDLFLARIQSILGKKLIGLYVFGSLVTGDFDYASSDIDLIAAISADLDEKEFESIKTMHDDIALNNKQWDDRIEVGYLSVENLKKAKLHGKIALISPGEPFHVKETETDWIINRYVVREKGRALFGPAPQTLIDPISQADLMQAMQELIKEWRVWINHTELIHLRKYQAFMILTMCRMLYTCKNGDFVSKKQAALWAQHELPAWSALIQRALVWREVWQEENVDHDATLPETLRFVHFVLNQCESESGLHPRSSPPAPSPSSERQHDNRSDKDGNTHKHDHN